MWAVAVITTWANRKFAYKKERQRFGRLPGQTCINSVILHTQVAERLVPSLSRYVSTMIEQSQEIDSPIVCFSMPSNIPASYNTRPCDIHKRPLAVLQSQLLLILLNSRVFVKVL
jgi:hypothetical protein